MVAFADGCQVITESSGQPAKAFVKRIYDRLSAAAPAFGVSPVDPVANARRVRRADILLKEELILLVIA